MNENYTTIVTCYFKIKSKHSLENYNQWMSNMLENISTPMMIYCDSESEDFIRKKRNKFFDNTKIEVITFDDFYTNKYKQAFINHHSNLDPEKVKHNPELYMIWAEKSNFLKKTKEKNPFNSKFFFWCDIGCFRNRTEKNDIPLSSINNFPNEEKIKSIPNSKIILTRTGVLNNKCCKLNSNGLTQEEFTFYSHSIGGTMFGGHYDIINEWHSKYYNTLERFIQHNRFAGKDQNIMANMTIQYPDLCIIFNPTYGDPWFYFHWLLS